MSNSRTPSVGTSLPGLLVLCAVLTTAPLVQAGYMQVHGGPTHDPASGTGLVSGTVSGVNNTGTTVGQAYRSVSWYYLGCRAVRWDGSGAPATELESLGMDPSGYAYSWTYAVNNTGTTVGVAEKLVSGQSLDVRAVRWDAGATAATELDNLGTDPSGSTFALAHAVNDAGTAVGWAEKHVSGSPLGRRAVRWEAGGTAATELGNLGTGASGQTFAYAQALNQAGTAVGSAHKYVLGNDVGERAVRWEAGGTAATELAHIGTSASGWTTARALAVNDAGTTVGLAEKHISGNSAGFRAVRWNAGGTAATELGNLGTDASGYTYAYAQALNEAGTAVGLAQKYVLGNHVGERAVRWDAGGTAATELGDLGTDPDGVTWCMAMAISDTGTAVGSAQLYVDGVHHGSRAVMWGLDGVAIDLNTLIDPSSGWTLTGALAISDNGLWIAGAGVYDPDGAGPLAEYDRMWVIQVSEPATLGLLTLGGLAVVRRRRK